MRSDLQRKSPNPADLFTVFHSHKQKIINSLDRDDELKYWIQKCCDLKIFDIQETSMSAATKGKGYGDASCQITNPVYYTGVCSESTHSGVQ